LTSGHFRTTPGRIVGKSKADPGPDWVIKVGGSLGARPAALRRLMATLGRAARRRRLLVVPGGGSFADEIRRADRRFGLGDSAAHWMAILAMDQYGHLLARLTPGAALVRHPRDVKPGRLNILLPSSWLVDADPLPHSWDVTSDSIAAWVVRAVRAPRLMLVKDVDGFLASRDATGNRKRLVRRVALGELSGVVDPYFARALDPTTACWVVRGTRPGRVATLLATGRTHGTEVVSRGRSKRRRD
jgi:5-(aminomethyl)-3-furanmethanol phosphate kinase